MKSIKEKAKLVSANPFEQEYFETGANYALNAIEEFMANLHFGSNAAEMFYKDIKTNIHKFIEELKKK